MIVRNFIPITKETLPPLDNGELAALRNNEKIRCIKMYRDRVKVGLVASKAAADHEQAEQKGEEFDWAKFGTEKEQYKKEIARLQSDAQYAYQRTEETQDTLRRRTSEAQDAIRLRGDNNFLREDISHLRDEVSELKEVARSAISLLELVRKHNL